MFDKKLCAYSTHLTHFRGKGLKTYGMCGLASMNLATEVNLG